MNEATKYIDMAHFFLEGAEIKREVFVIIF